MEPISFEEMTASLGPMTAGSEHGHNDDGGGEKEEEKTQYEINKIFIVQFVFASLRFFPNYLPNRDDIIYLLTFSIPY